MYHKNEIVDRVGIFLQIFFALIVGAMIFSCATPEIPGAEAANRAAAGASDGKSGSTKIDTQALTTTGTGDNTSTNSGWSIEAQRNSTSTKGGETIIAVQAAAGGAGSEATQRAIDNDAMIKFYRARLEVIGNKQSSDAPSDRLFLESQEKEMIHRISTRISEIKAEQAASTPVSSIGPIYQTNFLLTSLGKDHGPLTEADASALSHLEPALRVALGHVASQPTSHPTSQPSSSVENVEDQ